MSKRTPHAVRKEEILTAALDIAKASSLAAVSGKKIAARLGTSRPNVAYHITDMAALRRNVMHEAIRVEALTVIAQGLANGDPIARAAPEALRRRAADGLVG